MTEQLQHLKKYYKEIKKEKATKLPTGRIYYVYNPLTDTVREENASPIDIVHNKHCYDKLRYFIKDEEELNEKQFIKTSKG